MLSAAPSPAAAAAQPAHEIGNRAATLLLDQITGTRQPPGASMILPVELIIRRFSAPPRAAGARTA